jgi:pimeloyl-ACP methyl ester carboxylesterase
MILSRCLQICVVSVTIFFASLANCATPPRVTACHMPGLEDKIDCIKLAVPLDWAKPDGAKIDIFAARLTALSRGQAKDAFVMIPGGPGQSGDALIPLATGKLKAIRQQRDIILIYPRGTARSNPLICTNVDAQKNFDGNALKIAAQKCSADQKYNPAFFTSLEIVKDIEALRVALNYPQLSIWGGSFGSRLAQHYARDYPAHTRLIVLDSVAPVGVSILETTPVAAQSALDNISASCAKDKVCVKNNGNISQRANDLINQLSRTPMKYASQDSISTKTTVQQIDGRQFASAVHFSLYDPNLRALVPQFISQAANGNFKPILAFSSMAGNSLDESIAVGANFSALCAEDYRITNAAKLRAVAAKSFLKEGPAEMLAAICPIWIQKRVPEVYLKPFKSNVPALLLSGVLDPITPPTSGAIAALYFTNSFHIIIPASSHISSAFGCAPRNIVNFVETLKNNPADWACIKTPTPPTALATPNG